jgi:hypothetical protein
VPAVYLTISYWLIGLNSDASKFFESMVAVIFIANCGCSFGIFVSALAPSPHLAVVAVSPITTPLMIFGGVYLNNRLIYSNYQRIEVDCLKIMTFF